MVIHQQLQMKAINGRQLEKPESVPGRKLRDGSPHQNCNSDSNNSQAE